MNSPKVIIIGVGNSGTKLLGTLINELLIEQGYPNYYYEPLYWEGTKGESGIEKNKKAINEHITFPLLADETTQNWPWMDKFIDDLVGLAKFIRLGSRIKLLINKPVKYIWITRELYSYLSSMQKNFPRCLPDKGWHHCPGEYDCLESNHESRIGVEAAWWHLHNNEMYQVKDAANVYHIRYEDLTKDPITNLKMISDYIEMPFIESKTLKTIHDVNERKLNLNPSDIRKIDAIANDLNRTLYPNK